MYHLETRTCWAMELCANDFQVIYANHHFSRGVIMIFSKSYIRLIAIILVAMLIQSCLIRRSFPRPNQDVSRQRNKIFNLIWEPEPSSAVFLYESSIADSILSGNLVIHQDINAFPPQTQIVRIWLDGSVTRPDLSTQNYQIPLTSITRLEVYDVDLGATIFISTLVVAGVAALAFVVAFVIFILTKESCPFIYSFNGDTYELSGEIYSGAIFPNMERHDYMILPQLRPHQGRYLLRMANEVEEIQHTNLSELRVVDHPRGTQLLVDKYGSYFTLSQPQSPISAVSAAEADLLPFLKTKDQCRYSGDDTADASRPLDSVRLSFDRQQDSDSARLVLRAKNSFWLDYSMGQFFGLFGKKYQKWYNRQTKSGGQNPNWADEQGIPLAVYIKRDGAWQYVDSFPVIGPIADRDVVMDLDLQGIDSQTLEVKLECGALFWEIDYAALDSSPQQAVRESIVSLDKATDQDGKDVRKLLLDDDQQYFTQPHVGDRAILEYCVPTLDPDMERTVVLHSKGHYQKLRQSTGKPDVAKLLRFREPGRFGSFSRELFGELKHSYLR